MLARYRHLLANSPPQLLVASSASAVFRYPVWLFMLNGGALQQAPLWRDDCALLCNWDCNYFAQLTQHLEPHAFFPLFPAFAHLYQLLTDTTANVAVLVTSNLCTLIAGVLSMYLGNALWPSERPILGFSASSWLLLASVSLFPHSHFWVRGYSEALFFCLCLGAVLALVAQCWRLAALLTGLSTVTRPQGLALLAAFAATVAWAAYRRQLGRGRGAVVLALASVPFAAFLGWNQRLAGDALYFATAQREGWHRHFNLLEGLASHLPKLDENHLLLYGSLAAVWYFLSVGRRPGPISASDSSSSQPPGGSAQDHPRGVAASSVFLAVSAFALAELPLFVGGFYSYGRFMSTNVGLLCAVAAGCTHRPAVAAGLSVWAVANLACNTHAVMFSFWTG